MPDPARIEIVFDEAGGGGISPPGGGPGAGAPRPGGGAPVGWSQSQVAAQTTAAAAAGAAVSVAAGRAVTALAPYGGAPPPSGGGGLVLPSGGIGVGSLAMPSRQQIFTGAGSGSGSAAASLAAVVGVIGAMTAVIKTVMDSVVSRLETAAKAMTSLGNYIERTSVARAGVLSGAVDPIKQEIEERRARRQFIEDNKDLINSFSSKDQKQMFDAALKLSNAQGEMSDKKFEAFLRESKGLRDRAETLGQYSGPLAGELARSRAAKIGRDIAEAQALGPQYAEFERGQRGLDVEKDVARMLERLAEMPALQKQADDERKRLEAKNNKILEGMSSDVKEGVRQMRGQQKTGLQKLFENGIVIPQGEENRAGSHDANRRQRDQQMNKPVLGGV